MRQYLGLKMQIPKEENYPGLQAMSTLDEFLKTNFEFPSDNLNDICNYISQDAKLERIIFDLPEIISKEFSKSPISLDFMSYTLPDETVLQISIKTPFDGETTSTKKDLIVDELLNNYESPKNYYFISMEF